MLAERSLNVFGHGKSGGGGGGDGEGCCCSGGPVRLGRSPRRDCVATVSRVPAAARVRRHILRRRRRVLRRAGRQRPRDDDAVHGASRSRRVSQSTTGIMSVCVLRTVWYRQRARRRYDKTTIAYNVISVTSRSSILVLVRFSFFNSDRSGWSVGFTMTFVFLFIYYIFVHFCKHSPGQWILSKLYVRGNCTDPQWLHVIDWQVERSFSSIWKISPEN